MIIVTGSIAFDHIMDFPGKFSDHILPDKLHVLSLSFLVDKLKKERGGTAGNIAYNLALLNSKPLLMGCVGKDFTDYRKHLEKRGVDTKGVKAIENDFTSSAFIMTDQKDNQISGFYPGAMNKNQELRIANNVLQKDTIEMVVISPNDPKAMKNLVEECITEGLVYMYDPGMQLPRISNKELKKGIQSAGILIGNDYEMAAIKEKLRTKDEKLFEENDKLKIIITTLGEKGCMIVDRKSNQQLKSMLIPPAKPEKVCDPTGAGDAFRAGFLAGYLRNFPLSVCGKMGNLAAVYAVEKYGTQNYHYTIREFCLRYQKNFKEKLVI